MPSSLSDYLRDRARGKRLTDGKEYHLVSLDDIRGAAELSGLSIRSVELQALAWGLVPARYALNIPDLGFSGQQKLLRSQVAVIGAGATGGHVCELLARLGVGRVTVIDGDRFEDTNLNRQPLCAESDLGKPKAEVAAQRMRAVNRAVEVMPVVEFATESSLPSLIPGAELVLDCVDNAADHLMLQRVCHRLGVPMVYGCIGGFIGRVMTILPGDTGVRTFYEETPPTPEVGESQRPAYSGPPVGSPGVSPAAIAPWLAAEVVKTITGQGSTLRNRLLVIDLLEGRACTMPVWTARLGRSLNRFLDRFHRGVYKPRGLGS